MRVFLIRHGETVDNVAKKYAGSRDSELTNHGDHQAARLGQYFQSNNVKFTHIFSSHLKRAFKTAEHIRRCQDGPDVIRTPWIMEQDFGSAEGKAWGESTSEPSNETNVADFVPVETRESMQLRVDKFLETHLIPALTSGVSADPIIAIVSHGLLLGTLWRGILQRLPPKSVTVAPEIVTTNRLLVLEHLGSWGNTCYLELAMKLKHLPSTESDAGTVPKSDSMISVGKDESSSLISPEKPQDFLPIHLQLDQSDSKAVYTNSFGFADMLTTVVRVNSKEHLKNLKRTGGGVGSAVFDPHQRGIESFFAKKARKS